MKNDLRDEILNVPSSRPAPPPSGEPMQRNIHLSDGGGRRPVIQPMKIFIFEALFSKSLLIAQPLR